MNIQTIELNKLNKHQEKKLNVIMNSTVISGKYDDLKLAEILEELKLDDDKPYGRWFCFVTSDMCPEGEYCDVYVSEIKDNATKVVG